MMNIHTAFFHALLIYYAQLPGKKSLSSLYQQRKKRWHLKVMSSSNFSHNFDSFESWQYNRLISEFSLKLNTWSRDGILIWLSSMRLQADKYCGTSVELFKKSLKKANLNTKLVSKALFSSPRVPQMRYWRQDWSYIYVMMKSKCKVLMYIG